LTIDSAVYASAKDLGINASRVAEEALAAEVLRLRAEQLRKDIAQDLAALAAYEEKHGSFSEMVREHYGDADDE
jgi:post-segregation antitoxin (ccd killing protein)